MKKNSKKAIKHVPVHNPPQIRNRFTKYISALELPTTQRPIPTWGILVIGVVFLCVFTLYKYTLAPHISTGDSGELIMTAYTLGISHPPGYPLFNLLGHIFTWLPFGTIAERVNLSSAVFNLLAASFLYLTSYKLTKHWPSALFAAVFFATSPLIWEYSLKTEVFPLNNLLAALILYMLIKMRESYLHKMPDKFSPRIGHITLFICGLALTNHQTIILLAPTVILCIFFYNREYLLSSRTIFIGLGYFILGLSIYLYVPIRAAAEPYLNWDAPSTFKGFFTLISRADYGTFTLMSIKEPTYNLGEKLNIYLISLLKQVNLIGVALLCMGLFFLIRQKDKKLTALLVLAYFLTTYVFINIANLPKTHLFYLTIYERFYMLPMILVALFIGLGIYFLNCFILAKSNQLWVCLINGLIGISIGTSIISHFPKVNQNNNNVLYHYGHNILNSVDKNALLLVSGDDEMNSIDTLQELNKIRQDVIVLSIEKLSYRWYCLQMKKRYPTITIPFELLRNPRELIPLIENNIKQRSIYMAGIRYKENPDILSKYKLIPTGVVSKIITKDSLLNFSDYFHENKVLWKNYIFPESDLHYSDASMEYLINESYAGSHYFLALEYELQGLFDDALHEYEQAIHIAPLISTPYRNIGIIYADRKKQPEKAVYFFKTFLRLYPDSHERDKILMFLNKYS